MTGQELMVHPVGAFVCLMYHNICQTWELPVRIGPATSAYFVDEDSFAAQLGEMAVAGTRSLRFDALRTFYGDSQPGSGSTCRPHAVAITFDDGWRGAVDVGGPYLERSGHQAWLFVTSDLIGRPGFLERSELSRLSRRTFTVGSHGKTHRLLSLLSDQEVRHELEVSKRELENGLGYEVDCLSIPGGAVDERVRRIAQEIGYRFLFDSDVRVNRRTGNPMRIGRVAVMRRTSLDAFRGYIRHRIIREQLRRRILSVPKRVLGLARYRNLRYRLLGDSLEKLDVAVP